MVITLDNGQSVTIFENDNVIEQIRPYIDAEIYDLLEEHYKGEDSCLLELENLKDEKEGCDEAYEELERKYDNLSDDIDCMQDELDEKDEIIGKIDGLRTDIRIGFITSKEEIMQELNKILND